MNNPPIKQLAVLTLVFGVVVIFRFASYADTQHAVESSDDDSRTINEMILSDKQIAQELPEQEQLVRDQNNLGREQVPNTSQSSNEKCVFDTWTAHRNKNYEDAIVLAKTCVAEFQDQAIRLQEKLERGGSPPDPEDITPGDPTVLRRGVLNDVATAFWIYGDSARKLGHIGDAATAFTQCAKYTFAFTWDPRGWFWSPSRDCASKLKRLKR